MSEPRLTDMELVALLYGAGGGGLEDSGPIGCLIEWGEPGADDREGFIGPTEAAWALLRVWRRDRLRERPLFEPSERLVRLVEQITGERP